MNFRLWGEQWGKPLNQSGPQEESSLCLEPKQTLLAFAHCQEAQPSEKCQNRQKFAGAALTVCLDLGL